MRLLIVPVKSLGAPISPAKLLSACRTHGEREVAEIASKVQNGIRGGGAGETVLGWLRVRCCKSVMVGKIWYREKWIDLLANENGPYRPFISLSTLDTTHSNVRKYNEHNIIF